MADNKEKLVLKSKKVGSKGKNEDVEFSRELADENDLDALERAAQADARQDK